MNYVISNRSGQTMEDFLNAEVMRPIGAGTVYVRPEYKFGGHGFCSHYELTPRDYARIGYLFLRHGRWNQQRIIAKDVVALMTTRPPWLPKAALGGPAGSSDRPQENYAYTFWLNQTAYIPGLPTDAYFASGGNHKMIVIPSLDMIIVRVGNYVFDYPTVHRVYQLIREAMPEEAPAPVRPPQTAPRAATTASGPRPSKSLTISEFQTIPSGTHLEIEAESGISVPPMRVDTDVRNPQVNYVWTPNDVPPSYDTPGGPAEVGFAFHVPETKAYNVWIRTIAPDSHSDSYYLTLDGVVIERPWYTLVVPQSNEWRWTRIVSAKSIDAGRHVLELRNRESGIKLDKLVITSDLNFAP
jgi:hypothetical protein